MFWVERNAKPNRIIIGIIWIVFVNAVIFPYFPNRIDADFPLQKILDTRVGFMPAEAKQLFTVLGEKGREAYFLTSVLVDNLYALTYGFIYAFLLVFLLKKVYPYNYNSKRHWIGLPFMVASFDLLENVGIQTALLMYPKSNDWLLLVTVFFNVMKWFSGFVLLISVLSLFVKWIFKK